LLKIKARADGESGYYPLEKKHIYM
jgi:hypothetical protein